jgi:VWFA-related protein
MIRRRGSCSLVLRVTPIFYTCLAALTHLAQAQEPPAMQNPQQTTVRVKVGLVQTDVMVFDKQGHFVPDLKREQFELRIDGKVQPIEFFEMVTAGSAYDREIWARVEGNTLLPTSTSLDSTDPGRTLLLFLDDWHMAAESVILARDAVAELLNTSMGPKDRVGIYSASGQLAALQVLTNDKAALLESLAKYNFLSPGVQDLQYPAMTEAQALLVEMGDERARSYFVSAIVGATAIYDRGRWRCGDRGGDCLRAEQETRRRANAFAQVSVTIAQRTLSALRGLLRDAEVLPERKVVFFLSDGFVLQHVRSDIISQLRDLTTVAARAGFLIYTLDSRGLVTGTAEAKMKVGPDPRGARTRLIADGVSAPWDSLNALAVDTGGRFLKNTNALDTALITTLTEISRYYLLGWYINPQKLKPGKYSTIKASIKGRSDLSVRVRQGSLDLSQLIQDKK